MDYDGQNFLIGAPIVAHVFLDLGVSKGPRLPRQKSAPGTNWPANSFRFQAINGELGLGAISFLCVPSCPLWLEFLVFRSRRSRAISAITAIGALDRHSPLPASSARDPTPPYRPLLKTQAKVQFDRAVTERSKAIFPVFQGFSRGQFQPSFSAFTVRSAEGRKPFKYQVLTTDSFS